LITALLISAAAVIPIVLMPNVSAQTQPSNAREQKRVAILLSFWSRLILIEASSRDWRA
jgi:hypothetical protein